MDGEIGYQVVERLEMSIPDSFWKRVSAGSFFYLHQKSTGMSMVLSKYHGPPKTMKNEGFGHLKPRLFTIKPSKNVGFGGPWYIITIYNPYISTK